LKVRQEADEKEKSMTTGIREDDDKLTKKRKMAMLLLLRKMAVISTAVDQKS
jgi:hypothetical protein